MDRDKIFGLVALFCALFTASVVGGHYLGAWVFLKLAHIHTAPNWHTLQDYSAVYGHHPVIVRWLVAGQVVSIAVSLLPVVLLGLVLYALRRKFTLYGEARFASDTELEQTGFFQKAGQYPDILLGQMASGRHKGSLIRFSGQQFVCVSAPTRSGKGVSVVIPNLLHYRDSVVVLDIKQENFHKTAGFRKSAGQDVFLFAPDGYTAVSKDVTLGNVRSHRYNPLTYIRRSPLFRDGDILRIANILYPETHSENDLWIDLARAAFKGLVLYLLDNETDKRTTVTLAQVLSLTAVSGGLNSWMKTEIDNNHKLSKNCIEEFSRFCAQPDRTRGSVLANLVAPLSIFGSAVCAEATSSDDFDLRELRRKRMSVYFCVSPNNIGTYAKLINLFFSQLIYENTSTLPEQDETLKHQCLLVLDEFAAMGKVEIIQQAISFAAGYNLRFMLIFQSLAQLQNRDLYGHEGAKNILDNCAVKIIFPPSEVNEEAKSYSETLGYNTVKTSSHSKTRGRNDSRGTSTSEQRRALMLPQEIVELGQETRKNIALNTIVMAEKLKPFLAHKIISFEEEDFKKRLHTASQHPVEIPLLSFAVQQKRDDHGNDAQTHETDFAHH